MHVSYEEYVQCGGSASLQDFNGFAGRAAALVDYLIFPNVPNAENICEYKKAVFAVVDSLLENGDGESAGFQIGGFRANGQAKSGRAIAEDAAKRYLVPAGLMFMGVQ